MISVSEWQPEYGDPHNLEDTQEYARVWEHEVAQAVDCVPEPRPPLAFVDGVRRGEAWVYLSGGSRGRRSPPENNSGGSRGRRSPPENNGGGGHALAAVLATGAVVGNRYEGIQVERVFVRPSGCSLELPPQPGGWSWRSRTLEPEQNPEILLQQTMRFQEAELALRLATAGQTVVLDGPLLGVAKVGGLPLVGCVKTQERLLLGPEQSDFLLELQPGQRSSLFFWAERHGCYVRLARRQRHQHPYFGLVRLETMGEAEWARQWLDRIAGWIGDFAGIAHLDPRAPQNLQPVAGLERELRRRCGDSRLALRALRQAVARVQEEEAWNESV